MRIQHFLYCLVLSLAHLAYTLIQPSILAGERSWIDRDEVLNRNYIEAFLRSRVEISEFARRPLTTWLIKLVNGVNIDISLSLVIVEYLGIFLALALLFKLSYALTNHWPSSYLSVLLFAVSFWFIHAFFTGIYAYDEPWQYVFLFASFNFLAKRQLIAFSAAFLLALIARESTALLLPGVFLFLIARKPYWSKENLIAGIKTLWVIPAYLLFVVLLIQWMGIGEETATYMGNERFKHWYFSFADRNVSIDTISALILSIAVPLALLIPMNNSNSTLKEFSGWKQAFWVGFILNTIIALSMTMGREARIFAQPVALIAPFLGLLLHQSLSIQGVKPPKTPHLLVIIVINAIALWIIGFYCLEIYWPTDTRYVTGFQHYAYLTLSIAWLILLVRMCRTFDYNLIYNKWFPIALILPILLFWNMQRGIRFHDLYSKVNRVYTDAIRDFDTDPALIVATHYPELVRKYFSSSNLKVFANDFNTKHGLHTLDHIQASKQAFYFVELEPTDYYPVTYALSRLGKVTELDSIEGHRTFYVDPATDKERNYTYRISSAHNRMVSADSSLGSTFFLDTQEEYVQGFKRSVESIGIDTLYSYAAAVRFKELRSDNVQLVMHITNGTKDVYWKGQKLQTYVQSNKAEHTAYMADFLPSSMHDSSIVSFYIWNPEQVSLTYADLELTLNTPFISKVKKRPRSEGSLQLR
ncbi:MAG: hypothetical protein Salg2KO_12880 [Salibacteraceae bacterium]